MDTDCGSAESPAVACRVSLLALLVVAPLSAWGQCYLPEHCRCLEDPLWAATIHLVEDGGAVLDTLSRRTGTDGGPSAADLAFLTGDAGQRFLMTPRFFYGDDMSGLYPIGADGQVHCANDSAYEAVGWAHSLTSQSCYARLKADKAVLERCNDVRRCGCGMREGSVIGALLLVGSAVAFRGRRRTPPRRR